MSEWGAPKLAVFLLASLNTHLSPPKHKPSSGPNRLACVYIYIYIYMVQCPWSPNPPPPCGEGEGFRGAVKTMSPAPPPPPLWNRGG